MAKSLVMGPYSANEVKGFMAEDGTSDEAQALAAAVSISSGQSHREADARDNH